MKKRILLTMGLAFLLAGCTNGNEPRKESTKETIATITTTSTESKSTATSTETADTSTSSESSKTTETTQTSTSSSSLEASSSSSESSEQVEQTLWNADKAAQLEAFMTTWGQTMGQQYKSYTNQMSVDLYGLKVPQAILNGEWKMAIGGVPASAEWSESGTGQADYQITAVYSDAETEPYLKKHVYLFGFQQNQPKVLVTQQNQGNPDNYLYFNETANNELKNGFNQIVYR
ncbi:DUF4767 domain-containing protein [Enterococcus lactis]|uniref:DUF4767 domain-containing protein n=1 Tax=Enterococcus TaxID=1350 RepID=UPI000CF18A27|nr:MULTISPECIES: DUF4767 domain-containing protein [Enterococcus]EGP4714582.1 DUF4767 domain-containing protein [Enterococcus faecium]EGP4828200.1 DUF4767 domain-containing protein [Enterococcus faecium]EGP5222963.1 DUF4767 domain-containing protein [Enterococcus faecium]EGP5482499.1 DUF4767 domain-containing protein [Enterococcus faecium]EGP5498702.1 DUF4767 domain-containing protein [Enterococcus faecium]